MNQTTIDAGRFDLAQIAASLPETATTLLVDHYLTNREAASARVFRVYRPTPPHYHATCDEYLYVFSGRGTFWMKNRKQSFSDQQIIIGGDQVAFNFGCRYRRLFMMGLAQLGRCLSHQRWQFGLILGSHRAGGGEYKTSLP